MKIKNFLIGLVLGIALTVFALEGPHYYDAHYSIWTLGGVKEPVICHGWGNFLQKGGSWVCDIHVTWEEIEQNCQTNEYGSITETETIKNYGVYRLGCKW